MHSVLLTIFNIYFVLYQLVTSEHHGGFNTPHHEVVVIFVSASNILFNSKKERQLEGFFSLGNNNIFHCFRLNFSARRQFPPTFIIYSTDKIGLANIQKYLRLSVEEAQIICYWT